MARIAIDARFIGSSTGRYVHQLVEHLQDVDSENQYLVLVPSASVDLWKPRKSNFTVLTADFGSYSMAEQWGFYRFLKALDCDLVHFGMPQHPVLYRNPFVVSILDLTLLDTSESTKNKAVRAFRQFVGRWVFRDAARRALRVITLSNYVAQQCVSRLGAKRSDVRVTYLAADLAASDSTAKAPFDEYLIYIGSQQDYKNIRALAEAHQRLLSTRPRLGLVLVGRKDAPALANERLFGELGYQNILFTGFMEDSEMVATLRSATAYVFPSLSEGFGLPGLEAMASGVPVLSSDASCLPEIYGEAAYYFDPHDPASIAAAIETVLASVTLRDDLVERGRRRVAEFSWRRTAEETHAVYEEALRSRGAEGVEPA